MSMDRTETFSILGNEALRVSSVGLGCWPMAGITSVGVTDEHSLATIQAALDAGINFFDTAYAYGYEGQSDRILSHALRGRRDRVVLASKVGMFWDANKQRVYDGRPETLLKHAQEVLRRLDVEYVDLMYLHAVDPLVTIEKSAEAIAEIVRRGWARWAGVSNVDLDQARRFHTVCPVIAMQPPFNMLQQQSVSALRDFCREHTIGLVCYWVLMKGLLAGHLNRDHQFDPRDRRLSYEIFRGELWKRNQDFLDHLRAIAQRNDCTVSQLVVAWTLQQPVITVALCGAKRPEQIVETAAAMHLKLAPEIFQEIDQRISEYHKGTET